MAIYERTVVLMMLWIWVALLAVFIIIEASTAQLLTIWFAIGSFASLVTSFFTESILIQVIVFVVVSAIALIVTRPLVKKVTATKKQATNADMYIGQEGIVTEAIDNIAAKGLVKVKGSVWTARSETDNITIPEGTHISVVKIEGVKLIVCPITDN